MGFYIEELPTELNGITMEEADYLADEFLKDEPCNRMWDAMRALRDFYETVTSEAIEMADRKTENSSEKPNNCDTCRHKGAEGCEQPCLGCGCCGLYEAITGNDKLKEKVVEFIKSCARCKHRPIGAMMCEESCHYEPKDEPQTYKINPKEPTNMPKCFDCEDFFTCDGQCEIECEKCKHFREEADTYMKQCEFYFMECRYEPKDEPQKWEKPPKFDHKGIQTACVTVPMALIEDEPQTERSSE